MMMSAYVVVYVYRVYYFEKLSRILKYTLYIKITLTMICGLVNISSTICKMQFIINISYT